jgi:hypothetical protein
MSAKKEMTELHIASKLKAGKEFYISTEREQKRVLTGSKYLGIEITTRSMPTGGFVVKFIK